MNILRINILVYKLIDLLLEGNDLCNYKTLSEQPAGSARIYWWIIHHLPQSEYNCWNQLTSNIYDP
jgi:hypothetical protein